ncbi:MAG TPA: TIGR02453 family protein [Microscillaceae bacterium]|jgi:uncharacterized protein (TIGR02453 family)|nr:TIGR02453 family protein [Microscillaceae bacterium]
MKAIFDFLNQLAENNNRAWLDEHRSTYIQIRAEFEKFIIQLWKQLAEIDPTLQDLEPKKCIFRLARDTRFSKDKKPYKINLGAYFAKGGRKSGYAGYYFHLQPGDQSFLAGGLYNPTPQMLLKVRKEIEYNYEELENILADSQYGYYFGPLEGDQSRITPLGFDKNHPAIALIRMKSFTTSCALTDKKVRDKDITEYTIKAFTALKPLVDFLNKALDD